LVEGNRSASWSLPLGLLGVVFERLGDQLAANAACSGDTGSA
jgi:hypothetical protein